MSFPADKEEKIKTLLQSKKIDCEVLCTYEGFEDVKDEEGAYIIEQLERFATIIYKHVINEQQHE